MTENSIAADERAFLRRCVELAREALEAGDEPFGSILVSADGDVLFEDRNRVASGDNTQHPEFAIALGSSELKSRGACCRNGVYLG